MAKRKYGTYVKLNDDVSLDYTGVDKKDYDATVEYIQTTFAETLKHRRDLDQTLKRRFIFSRAEKKPSVHWNRKHKGSHREYPNTSKLRSFTFTPRNMRYNDYAPLRELWASYVSGLIGKDTKAVDVQTKLNRVDMHGAYVKVTESKCESFVGLEGIVVEETRNTFLVVTQNNLSKRVPKCDTVFSINIPKPEGTLEVIGNNFVGKSAERAAKKIKSFAEKLTPKTHRKLVLRRN